MHESTPPGLTRFGRTMLAIAGAAILSGISACAPLPAKGPESVSDFPRLAARETVAAGLERIVDRYLDVLTVKATAMEGLRGLATIDPALTVHREGGAINLKTGDRIVSSIAEPASDDVGAWAGLTVDIAESSRAVSRGMREADIEKVYEALFDGSLSHLDIFSRYAGAEEAQDHRAKRDGFGGIGIAYVSHDDFIRITQVIADSPAADIGLGEDDLIMAIDGAPTAGMSPRTVLRLLRGPIGSLLTLTVRAAAETRDVQVYRTHIVPNTVTVTSHDGVVFVAIKHFNQSTAADLAMKIETALQADGQRRVGTILDLRGNPGGLLKQAVRVVDLFLTEGDIIETRGRHQESLQHYEATGRDITNGLPLVVLVDGKSASASEIVAAALQDQGRAVIVGTTSFGKGTVQTVIQMPNSGEITLTWSRLISPSGYALHGLGVKPHICTSGIDDNDDAAAIRLLAQAGAASATLADWRNVNMNDISGRRALRAACPAERRTAGIEARVGRRLLTNPTLYARAVNTANSVAAAGR